MAYAVIIPSKNANNLIPCLTALRQHEPKCPVIVVDDGLSKQAIDQALFAEPIYIIRGVKPFVFARNINIGIMYAFGIRDPEIDGIVLLNDDALLESTGGFGVLEMCAASHPSIGIIGATTNLTGQPLQRRKLSVGDRGLRRVPHIAFVCVYIPRCTIERVGLLDERYVGYGCDDADYCEAVARAGLNIAVHDGCYVDHAALHSSYRGAPDAGGDFSSNYKLLMDKWGRLVTQP